MASFIGGHTREHSSESRQLRPAIVFYGQGYINTLIVPKCAIDVGDLNYGVQCFRHGDYACKLAKIIDCCVMDNYGYMHHAYIDLISILRYLNDKDIVFEGGDCLALGVSFIGPEKTSGIKYCKCNELEAEDISAAQGMFFNNRDLLIKSISGSFDVSNLNSLQLDNVINLMAGL